MRGNKKALVWHTAAALCGCSQAWLSTPVIQHSRGPAWLHSKTLSQKKGRRGEGKGEEGRNSQIWKQRSVHVTPLSKAHPHFLPVTCSCCPKTRSALRCRRQRLQPSPWLAPSKHCLLLLPRKLLTQSSCMDDYTPALLISPSSEKKKILEESPKANTSDCIHPEFLQSNVAASQVPEKGFQMFTSGEV